MRRKQTKIGTRRRKSRFLWFPKVIDGTIRWLETAIWQERYTQVGLDAYWKPIRWVD